MTPQPEPISAIAGSVLPLQRAEELLATLQEVVSARIVADANGNVDAIHVLVTGDSSPKQMVRNVESALMAQLGLRVDHRKISIATTVKRPEASAGAMPLSQPVAPPPSQFAPDDQPLPRAARESKQAGDAVVPWEGAPRRELYFEDVEIRGSRTKGMVCKVTLTRGAERIVGESEGNEADRNRIELSARATLAAIGMVEGASRRMTLEGTKVIEAFDRELILVGVMVRQGRTSTLLIGSCEVTDSAETASALAVLNATNRWVEGVK